MNTKLTVTAPTGAFCHLHTGVLTSMKFSDIDPQTAIPVTQTVIRSDRTVYCYEGLEPGNYHFCAVLDGFTSVCQLIDHTGDTAIDIHMDRQAGTGYEKGYILCPTPEFTKNCFPSRKDTWGEAYAGLFRTPQFLRKVFSHQQTTNEELQSFIGGLNCPYMHVFSLGSSPKYGYDIPLVLFTREAVEGMTLEQAAERIRSNGKPTVQYDAQCHSTEPASCEGALAMMLSLCEDFDPVLDKLDVYIIPRMNPDGAFEAVRQSPTTDQDMNRDYLYMNNAEVRLVTGAYNMFRPEVVIDGHERFHPVRIEGNGLCHDAELQTGAGALNHPTAMTALTMKMALQALEKGRSLGLRGHFYSRLASACGGAAGSSYFGLRNSLSFLIETPGQVYWGMSFMERRVMSHYTIASALIEYTAENAKEIMDTVHSSRRHILNTGPVYDESDLITLEHAKSKTGSFPTPLIHVPSGRVVEEDHTEDYYEHTEAVFTRPRATAYVVPRGLVKEQELLRVMDNHQIGWYCLEPGSSLLLRQYIKGEETCTLAQEAPTVFENGCYVFPNIIDSTILNVVMEPDFNYTATDRKMNVLTMGLLQPDEKGCLPLYRYCHDLQNGRL